MVRSLLTASGQWNSQLIYSSFVAEEAEAILSLPIGASRRDDSLLWHFEKSGSYTVKSGYRLSRLIQFRDDPSSSMLEDWWKTFWNIRLPQKVKIFLWKACHNWLPTLGNLARRGVEVEGRCPVCKEKPETTMHALWGCRSIKDIRGNCYLLKTLK